MKKLIPSLLLLAAGSASAAVTAGNLLAFYDFNGNANDTSGNGANATLAGGAVVSGDGAGYSGNAGDSSLDVGASGNSARANATIDLSSATTANSMAVSFWQFDIGNGAGANAANTTFTAVSTTGGGARGFQSHSPWSDGNLYFDHGGSCCGGANRRNQGVGLTLLNGWHHIVLQVDNGAKEIWVDGVRINNQTSGAAAIPTYNNSFTIGAEGATGANSFGGRLDEFAVWNTSLSPDDIAALAGGAETQSILVPEPSSSILMLLGGIAVLRRRR